MRTLVATLGLLLAAAAAVAGGEEAPNLLANGSFDAGAAGWRAGRGGDGVGFDWSRDGGREGTGGLHVRASGRERTPWIWWGAVDAPPQDRALRISGWIRGAGVEELAAICVQAWDDEQGIGFATSQAEHALRGDFGWTHVAFVLPATEGMTKLRVLAFVVGKGEAWFDELRVETTDLAPAAPPREAPGLVLVTSASSLWSERDVVARVLLPMPLSYREQVPLTYELATEPGAALARAVVREDRPGNFVADVLVRLKGGEPVGLSWRSLVLAGERSFADVAKRAPIPAAWPEEARPWLRATRCVQSDHPRFAEIAKTLREGTDDVLEVVRRVERRAAEAFEAAEGRVTELTALEALDKEGSCTSCANLVAALLRASGVPARVLAGYPTWSGPLQTHYVVEAYVPAYGWYPIESTRLESPWPPYRQIQVSIVPPEHEDASAERSRVAGGVPYLSLTEVPTEGVWKAGTLSDRLGCDHAAELLRALPTGDGAAPAWTAALARARQRWASWLAAPGRPDASRRFGTPLRPEDVTATSAAELAEFLAR